MNERRLIFAVKPITFPAGGVATIYRHVEMLHAHGLPAYVALSKRPRVDFYRTSAPLLIYGSRFSRSRRRLRNTVRTGDIWVVPEVHPEMIQALVGTAAKRILF